ncbi:Signal transducer and activator of transcription 1-alpha/beta [Collichthys lucidus]|uniref:Signal transducer and activator of transcription n=1 Tax=Collichthys lucidus TaxID=240159 RepID=A0A4U5UB08_COLLU|nr:Signal transducer and activator of transcription 1-alpha/beta [Collichthys lucidus]
MAQWEKLRQLPVVYGQQLHELYDRDALPMDVRHYLSAWIEKQEWQRAARDHDLAMVLFQVLLENLDIQHSRFVQEESFLLQHNIRRYKQNFQRYLDDPCALAGTILWFLEKEKEILRSADLAEQVQFLRVEQEAMETSSQQDLERKMAGLKNEVQSTLSDLNKLLDKIEELNDMLVKKELVEWQRRQQKACIGAPDNVCLDQLENWFTCVAVCLFQVREFLSKLEELVGKLSYANDPVKAQKPALQSRTDTLLEELLKSSFVVETQPSMPQGKGPLVLRTNVQFSVKTRLLVKVPELNHSMKVNVSMDRYRRFNVLGSKTKALNMAESQSGGMVADFRHLISLSVTEELHLIYFDTVFEFKGLSVELQDVMFFANCPAATWPQFGEMLSWQFLSATKRGLNDAQLEMIAHRLFGKKQDYGTCKVAWSKFSKENPPDTFWVWFDGILVMVKTYLENLWRDGHIMGFVNKSKEKSLLKKKQRGTFLLRFSESVIGAITFSWVDTTITGEPDIKTVQPFTKVDLSQIPFHEIIRNFQILEAENIPENPLVYLYPNTPKDEAFGKYYTEKTGSDSPYIKYIKTKLMFVSKENTLEAKSPMPSDMAQGDALEPINGLCEEAAGCYNISLQSFFVFECMERRSVTLISSVKAVLEINNAATTPVTVLFPSSLSLLSEPNEDPQPLTSPLEMYHPDPMLSSSVAGPEEDLLMYLNNPNLIAEIMQEEPALPDYSLQAFHGLPVQSCGSIFQ